MTDAADEIGEFIDRARRVSIAEAATAAGLKLTRKGYTGACPACGGKDRFSINLALPAWNCRGAIGGRDGIGLMAHVLELDTRDRTGFLEACAAVLGEAIPQGGERESDDERAARLERLAERRRRSEQAAAKRAADQNSFREREAKQARGIFFNAGDASGSDAARYLCLRTGFDMPASVFESVRFSSSQSYWHGEDDFGRPVSPYAGPAMVAPFVDPAGRVTGCHVTWIDLRHAPKFRPDLGLDDTGKPLPTKKMRGAKKGSLVPLLGEMAALRWLGGEGIETVLAVAGAEGFRADTFYFATGDLGNLAGPADQRSAFSHPTLKKADAKGVLRPVRIQGPVPKPDQGPDDAVRIADHVTTLVLLADGDSEFVKTAAAMARAETRLTREGRTIDIWWPPEGEDFASAIVHAMQKEPA